VVYAKQSKNAPFILPPQKPGTLSLFETTYLCVDSGYCQQHIIPDLSSTLAKSKINMTLILM